MSLMLTICAAPASVSIPESSKTFDANGGTLGRGNENTWVLDDPERYLSSLHCQISCEGGQYYLTDLSTNGTFLNGIPDPMGKGRKLPLKDGDKFSMGDYEFAVNLWDSVPGMQPSAIMEPSSGSPAGGSSIDDFLGQDPFASNNDFDQSISSGSNPFDSGYVPQAEPLFSVEPEETDPLRALDKANGTQSFASTGLDDPFSDSSYSDQADPLNQQISWPESVTDTGGGIIPDDWDTESISTHPVASSQPVHQESSISLPQQSEVPSSPPVMRIPEKREQSRTSGGIEIADTSPAEPSSGISKSVLAEIQKKAIAQANAKYSAEIEKLKKQIQAQKSRASSDASVDRSLVESLGFQVENLTDEHIVEINTKAGEVIRESVKGLMQVLSSRSAIKNEFRMNVTTIQPVENNPLKFSANVDDALENMFLKQGNAYKKPIEAVQEGFAGIAEHQVAIIAGIRAAFKSVIVRFEPSRLEERFSKGSSKVALIPGVQKAKNWDLYSEYYTDLVGDLDNSFQYLFGEEFVQAYEDQLRKLAMAKKEKAKG